MQSKNIERHEAPDRDVCIFQYAYCHFSSSGIPQLEFSSGDLGRERPPTATTIDGEPVSLVCRHAKGGSGEQGSRHYIKWWKRLNKDLSSTERICLLLGMRPPQSGRDVDILRHTSLTAYDNSPPIYRVYDIAETVRCFCQFNGMSMYFLFHFEKFSYIILTFRIEIVKYVNCINCYISSNTQDTFIRRKRSSSSDTGICYDMLGWMRLIFLYGQDIILSACKQ